MKRLCGSSLVRSNAFVLVVALLAPTGFDAATQLAGTPETNPQDGQTYVWIPPGTFEMGCSNGDNNCLDDEKPRHTVRLTKGFWLGKTEVTVGAFKGFVRATDRQMPREPTFLDRPLNRDWREESQPMVNVAWDDAMAYCQWGGGRLPTEAQWEYAARGGSAAARYGPADVIAWHGGDSGDAPLDAPRLWNVDQANYVKRLFANGNRLHDVGEKQPNAFGLYDMLGNVWEWVQDWFDENYYRQQSASIDPVGPASGQHRSIRGGSWSFNPQLLRVSNRGHNRPDNGNDNRGFRCAR